METGLAAGDVMAVVLAAEIGQADATVHGVVDRIREHYLSTGEITQTQWFILLEVNRRKLEREIHWLEAA